MFQVSIVSQFSLGLSSTCSGTESLGISGTVRCPSCHLTNRVKAMKENRTTGPNQRNHSSGSSLSYYISIRGVDSTCLRHQEPGILPHDMPEVYSWYLMVLPYR